MNQESNEHFMRLAIKKAQQGISQGQTPFAACLVKDNKVIACEHNVVWMTTDITAHAEVRAIRIACQKQNSIDLSGCTIYSTCEPCPMCLSACHWARIEKIVYGADIADAEKAGFNELNIPSEEMKRIGGSDLTIQAGFLKEECQALFQEWCADPDRKLY